MGTQGEDLGREHHVGAEQRFDAHRRGDVGDSEQAAHVVTRERQHAQHAVGAVDEREPLLRLEDDGLDLGLGKDRAGPDTLPVDHDLAFAEQDERDMRERREVTTAAERTVLGHPRRDARREKIEQPVGEQRSGAAASHREGARSQQHHRPHDLGLDWVTHAGSVRSDQRRLQPGPARGLDVHVGERAESSRHAVDGLTGRGQRFDDVARGLHRRSGPLPQHRPRTIAGHRNDVVDRKAVAVDDDVGHEFSRPSRFSASVYSFASIS